MLKAPQNNLKLRGFTSHEEIGLTNMNARLYDPMIGRFISADSIIPNAENPLAYNRYMYVYGNPISYRDPDGHNPWLIVGAAVFFTVAHMTDSEILQAASTIALGASVSYATGLGFTGIFNNGYIGAGLGSSFSSLTVSFAKTGQLTEESLKSAAISGIAAAVAYGIGHGGPNGASPFDDRPFFKAGMHGATSGMRSVLEGGEFHHGFIAGLAGHFSGELTGSVSGTEFQDVMSRTMVAASFGGISSSATGGDFVQGAMVAATVHLFNNEGGRLAQKGNSGARRAAARRAAAARGSTTMPELAEGRYLAVIDSISGELLIDVEMGDLWIIDSASNRHLHFGFVGLGGGVTIGGSVSRQFGGLSVSSASNVEGFSFHLEIDGTAGVGGTGSFQLLNQSLDSPSAFGGIGVGLEAGISGVGSYTWFKKVYDANDSPLVLSP